MSANRQNYGPEFEAAQQQHEIDRNKSILRNPKATDEDRRVAMENLVHIQNPDLTAAQKTALTETKVPPERTTGEHDAAIKEGGGIPGGVMKGDPSINLPTLVLFHDPLSGTTLALPESKVNTAQVKLHIEKSREQYATAAK